MATALELHLEAVMAAAFEAGNDHAFTVARNRREVLWKYRDGIMSLEDAKRAMAKIPGGTREVIASEVKNWDGDLTEV